MTTSRTIQVELTVNEAHAVMVRDSRSDADHETASVKIRAALALGALELPWEVEQPPPGCMKWGVRGSARTLAGGLTEPQARLVAAAPEMATALREWEHAYGEDADDDAHFNKARDLGCDALQKAGRRND